MKNINVFCKSNDLITTLETHFTKKINLAKVKFILSFIIVLPKVRTATFENIARAYDSEAETDFTMRRIQRFMANYTLNSDMIAKLIFRLIPKTEHFTLSIDRIN